MAIAGNGTSKTSATIFDVAQAAGVSIKTVSRVVNDEPNVREKTREKVLKAIAKLDYRPNAAARGLSSKRSYVIGLIYENAHEFSYMKHILDGALAVCEDRGYTLLLRPLTLPNENLIGQIRTFVTETRVDGVVLPAPMGDVDGVVDVLTDLDLPFAAISPRNPKKNWISIFCEEAQASRELVEYLIEQGHERIGFVAGHPDHLASEERLKGYRDALEQAKLSIDQTLVVDGLFTFPSGQKAGAELFDLEEPPTAIVASSDDMAAGVAFEAQERGLKIPGDVSLVGFDDTPIASQLWPPLTTVRQPIAEMSSAATRHLIRRIQGQEEGPAEAPFKCEVVLRQSTGPK